MPIFKIALKIAYLPTFGFSKILLNFDKKINSKFNLLLKYGRGDRDRTCGLMVPNHARYQLRYTSINDKHYYNTF